MTRYFECTDCGKTTTLVRDERPQCGHCKRHNGVICDRRAVNAPHDDAASDRAAIPSTDDQP